MADKITNFEDYVKKESSEPKKEPQVQDQPEPKVADLGDTTEINKIEIEDPYHFFTEEEREEYYRVRERGQKSASEEKREPAHEEKRDEKREPAREESREPARDERRDPRREDPRDDEDYDDEYDDDYDDEDYDEDYEDDEEPGGITPEVIVRIMSVITGIFILAMIVIFAKVKIFDRYFAPDPDEQVTTEVALPDGYKETNDKVVVVNAESLNLRTVPSSEKDETIVTSVSKGTELSRIAVSEDGSWALVEYNGQRLYASMKYLSTP